MTTWRSGLTIAVSLIVLSPLLRGRGWDDFPLSSYPMFSRGDVTGRGYLAHVRVRHADGRSTPATPSEVGTPEPMVANAILTRAINEGRAEEICRVIARNVHDADAVAVDVVVSEYDARRYFAEGRREPETRWVSASCAVTP